MIIRFFEEYGWIMTLLATTGIFFVGCLKAVGIFSKLKDGIKKYVYFATACIVSIISCTVYLCVTDSFVWADWGMTAAFIIAYTMAIYAMYENSGIRALMRKLVFNPIKKFIKNLFYAIYDGNLNSEQAAEIAKKLGREALMQLASELGDTDGGDFVQNAAESSAADTPLCAPIKLDGKQTLFL